MSQFTVIKEQILDTIQHKLPDRSLCLVPDDAFFTVSVDLPEDLSWADTVAFIDLAIESRAPFPMEQLLHGFLICSQTNRAFAFAAHKMRLRRIGIEDPEHFFHLFPAFLALHGQSFPEPTVRFLADQTNLTAVCFPAHSTVPDHLKVLPLGENKASLEDLRAARAQLLQSCPTDYSPEPALHQLTKAEVLPTEQPFFHLTSYPDQGEPEAFSAALPLAGDALWAADLRDPDFIQRERAARRRSRAIWRSLKTAAVAAVLLLLLQITNASLAAFNTYRENQFVELEPAAQRVENKLTLASRLTQSTEEDLQPFLLMEAINPLRPDTVYFDEIRSRAYNQLRAEGFSNEGVTPVNAFADSIQERPFVQSIENNVQTRNNQTSFELVITFSEMPPPPQGGFQIPEEETGDPEEETEDPEENPEDSANPPPAEP